jgi:tRNA pseudouridine55 synthase
MAKLSVVCKRSFSFDPIMNWPGTYQDLVDGWLFLIDKPLGWTSFDVVNKIKGHLKSLKKRQSPELQVFNVKVGHAGTLDPLASGLLLVCVGKKTKEIDQLQVGIKAYSGVIMMGQTTPSFDLETVPEGDFAYRQLTEEQYRAAALSFVGEQWQTPPVFSAKQIDGKRAYELARKGVEVKMNKSLVEIFSFDLTRIAPPEIHFSISCSKGTYIRSIANDFGVRLQSGSYLAALRREGSLPFSVQNANTMDEINTFFNNMKNN